MSTQTTAAKRKQDLRDLMNEQAKKNKRRMMVDASAAQKFNSIAMQGGYNTGDVIADWLMANNAALPRTRNQVKQVQLMRGNGNRPDAEQLEEQIQAWGDARLKGQGGSDL